MPNDPEPIDIVVDISSSLEGTLRAEVEVVKPKKPKPPWREWIAKAVDWARRIVWLVGSGKELVEYVLGILRARVTQS